MADIHPVDSTETTSSDYGQSLEIPDLLHNVKNARRFAIDIGGSLAKLAYSTTAKRKTLKVSENPEQQPIYQITDDEKEVEVLSFVKFETKYIGSCLNFIKQNLLKHQPDIIRGKVIKVTGGGAFKYKDMITDKLGCQIDKEDEMDCLVTGCNFLLRCISDESFVYQHNPKGGQSQYKFLPSDPDIFPYMVVNIGSGVSILKVESETCYTRVGGTSMGGGTFWGLGAMLTGCKTFDELIQLASTGNHKNIDLLVKDIYGDNAVDTLGLPGDLLACSFGKVTRQTDTEHSPADAAQSLLFFISNDIGQLACLQAKLHNIDRIYFGGFFIRGHPLTMHSISYAIKYWSQGKVSALFLRHEGYLGAIGAYLKGAEEEDIEKYSWGESYLGSSGLTSPREPTTNMFEAFQISRHTTPLVMFPLLSDPAGYTPDEVDLTQDLEARTYWLECFTKTLDKFTSRAEDSQRQSEDRQERSVSFSNEYLTILSNLSTNPTAYGSLTVRSLLDMREQCLHNAHFADIYLKEKQKENEDCLRLFNSRVHKLDQIGERWDQLIRGVLAGNIFDWGAKAVADMLENGAIDFEIALSKLQARPWLHDALDAWIERITTGSRYKCVAIFCDNSGADILLGIIPLARQFLKEGTKVILCANSEPVVNDVTYTELAILIKRLCSQCEILDSAYKAGRLTVMETGQASPCLDLRFVDENLCSTLLASGTDLVITEGMGRAVHTNFSTTYSCDSIKIAVIKNEWLAQRLGGEMFSVIFKFEPVLIS